MGELANAIRDLDDPTLARIAGLISTYSAGGPFSPTESPDGTYSSKANPDASSPFFGSVRKLVDHAFSQPTVPKIYNALHEAIEDKQGKTWDERSRNWAEATVKIMNQRSPTGMKIALINYLQAKKDQDLRTQMNNDLSMCTAYLQSPTNEMVDSIFHKLIEKKKDIHPWSPSDINDPSLDEKHLAKTWFDRSKSSVLAEAPTLDDPTDAAAHPASSNIKWGQFRTWGIPSEALIKSYIDGSARGSAAFALTEKDLVQRVTSDLADRLEIDANATGQEKWVKGIEERIRDVVERCTVAEPGDHKEKYLKWKY